MVGAKCAWTRGTPHTSRLKSRPTSTCFPIPKFTTCATTKKPYWNLERARIRGTRKVPVEVVVNGEPVASSELLADGQIRDLEFYVPIPKSSWIALRILPSSHTNPIFALVDGKPIRASRRSAEWCLAAVDQCWSQKAPQIREQERDEARGLTTTRGRFIESASRSQSSDAARERITERDVRPGSRTRGGTSG